MTGIKLTAELTAAGYSSGEVRRLERATGLVHVRRGAYAPIAEADALARHRQVLEATVLQCQPGMVVSHLSAALLHDLPIWAERLDRVEFTSGTPGGGRVRRYVRVHGIPLPSDQVTTVGGFAATTLARTVLDASCRLPLSEAVAIGDAALRIGLERGELDRLVRDARRRHGIGTARRAAALLDGRADSPGESWSRVLFDLYGLPAPEPQFGVFDPAGRLVGWCDFGWRDFRTVGEFDGRIKYGRVLAQRQDVEEVLFAEKRREDAIRDLGWQVVRWTWADLRDPSDLLGRLTRAFERGRGDR